MHVYENTSTKSGISVHFSLKVTMKSKEIILIFTISISCQVQLKAVAFEHNVSVIFYISDVQYF